MDLLLPGVCWVGDGQVMQTVIALVATIIAASFIFVLTDSFLLAGITGVIGGFSWAHSQREA